MSVHGSGSGWKYFWGKSKDIRRPKVGKGAVTGYIPLQVCSSEAEKWLQAFVTLFKCHFVEEVLGVGANDDVLGNT